MHINLIELPHEHMYFSSSWSQIGLPPIRIFVFSLLFIALGVVLLAVLEQMGYFDLPVAGYVLAFVVLTAFTVISFLSEIPHW